MLGYLRSGNKRTKTIWWALIALTVLSFLIGFNFIAGLGREGRSGVKLGGGVGSVNGETVTPVQFAYSYQEQVRVYRERFATDPLDRDQELLQRQAWRSLVDDRLFAQQARRSGLSVTDADIENAMLTNPPSAVFLEARFQRDGRFDPQLYINAINTPGNDWSEPQGYLREQTLPAVKMKQRVLASLKISDAEVVRLYHDRTDRAIATVVMVPAADTGRSPGKEEDLRRTYETYRTRMAVGPRTRLGVLTVPKQFAPDEVQAVLEQGRALFARAQQGESFSDLARDYSEGPNATKGGVIDRWLSPAELGPMIGAAVQSKKPGELIEPIQQGSVIVLFRILDPKRDTTSTPSPGPGYVRLAQIMLKIRPAAENLSKQYAAVEEIAKLAQRQGLSKAVTQKGLPGYFETQPFDTNSEPREIMGTPDLAEWAYSSKKNAVSRIFETDDAYVLAQVTMQHQAGPPTRDEVGEQLAMLADAEHRVEMSKSRADQLAAALKSGKSLEEAAASLSLPVLPVQTSRANPDPRLGISPELVGMLFGAPQGKVIGPVRTPQGWLFARVESVQVAPEEGLAPARTQFVNETLQRRQGLVFESLVHKLRSEAKITDARKNGL